MYMDEIVFDNENKGIEYLRRLIKPGWTVTKTPNRYDRWDATITKGNKSFKVENKVRYISHTLAEKGLLLDANKVTPDVEYYFEFLPRDNEAYMITYSEIQDGINNGTITRDTQKCADKTYIDPNNKVEKNNLLIPLVLFTFYPLNCQDC